MDLFKKKTKIKCSFSFTLQAGNYIVATKDHSGQSKKEFASSAGLVLWDETHTFTCAMEQDPKTKKFEEKHMSFTVLEAIEKDKERTIGKVLVNLGEVATHNFDEVKEVTVGKGKDKKGSLTIRWRTRWLTYNGKTVLSADETKGRPLTEVTRIEGTDVYCSSTAKTPTGGGGGGDVTDDDTSDADEMADTTDGASDTDTASTTSSVARGELKAWRSSADLSNKDNKDKEQGEKKEHRRSASLLGIFDKKDKDEKSKNEKEEKKEKKEKKEKEAKSGSTLSPAPSPAPPAASSAPLALPRFPSGVSLPGPESAPPAATTAPAAPTPTPTPTPAPAGQPVLTRQHSKSAVGEDGSERSGRSTKEKKVKKEKKEKKDKKDKKDKHSVSRGVSGSSVDADLTSEVLRLRTQLTEAERQLAEERKALTAEKAGREEDQRKARAELEARTSEASGARGEASRVPKELDGALTAARAEAKRAEESARRAEKQAEETRVRLTEAEAKATAERSKREALEGEVQKLRQQQQQQQQQQEQQLQQQAKQQQIKSPAVVALVSPPGGAEAETLRREVETLRRSVSEAESAKATQEKEAGRLLKKVAELERLMLEEVERREESKRTAEALRKTAEAEKQSAETERQRVEAERRELDAQRKELAKRESQVEERGQALAKKEQEVAEREALAAEKASTSRGVVKVKDAVEMSTVRKQYEQAEKQLAEAREERDKLRRELAEAQAALAEGEKVIIADIEPDRGDDARMAALQEDNERLRRLLADAEKAAAKAASPSSSPSPFPLSPSSSSAAAALADKVKRLVWTARYDVTRVGTLSMPAAGVELAHAVLETELPSALPSALFGAIVASSGRSGADRLGMAFWLSAACGMAQLLHKEKVVAWDVARQGPPPLADAPSGGAVSALFDEPLRNRRDIDPAVRALLGVCYSRALHGLMATLEPLLLTMFFPTSPPGAAADADAGMRRSAQAGVLATLSDQLKFLRDTAAPASVVHDVFVAVFGAADALLFNALLDGKAVCSAGRAVALKLGVAALDDWISANGLTAIWDRTRLQHISQASNLLMMDKSILLNEESARAAFPVLSAVHRVRLVELFTPDDLAPEPVPMAVRNAMQSLKARSAREAGPWLASPVKVAALKPEQW